MNKKYLSILILSTIVVLGVLFYRLVMIGLDSVKPVGISTDTQKTVYDIVELKSQADFALIGTPIYTGSGFEPGFSLKMNLITNKFGTDLVSQYGDTRYVGYLDLTSQSATSKTFSGKLLNKENLIVEAKIEIQNKTCGDAKGDDHQFSVNIKVSDEDLNGCADILLK